LRRSVVKQVPVKKAKVAKIKKTIVVK